MVFNTLNVSILFLNFLYCVKIILVRAQFVSLAQVVDELRPKKPNTMNL